MRSRIGDLLTRAKKQVITDFNADPHLKYILGAAFCLCGFYFWHRIPGFATIDESWRLTDVLRGVGVFFESPSLSSLWTGVLVERVAGATLYLYGIALIPVFVAIAVTSDLSLLGTLAPQAYPTWIWVWSLLITRFVVVVIAVGCVYLTYRIGVQARGRLTGKLGGILLTLTFGFLFMAHEVGEDIPVLFCILLVLSLALNYVKTGDRAVYLAGCLIGGFSIGFKLTAGVSAVILSMAYLLRARETNWPRSLLRPRFAFVGFLLGIVGIYVGYPEVIVAGPSALQDRILDQISNKNHEIGGPAAPVWWWMLRNYLSGLGLPLFIASVAAIIAGLFQTRERTVETKATIVLLGSFATYLLAYSRWEYVRIHHLLPTFPLLALLVAVWLSRLYTSDQHIARPLIVVLLLTSGAYATAGDLQYATSPRDDAATWFELNAAENASMDVYRIRNRDAVFPDHMKINTYPGSPSSEKSAKTKWMLNVTDRCPDYIQLTYWDLAYQNTHEQSQNRTIPWVATKGGPEPPWMPPFSAPRRAEYVRDLLSGEYPYRVTAKFGPEPDGWPHPRYQTTLGDLVWAGIVPWSVTYGDDQDLWTEQYTIILERTGRCYSQNRGICGSSSIKSLCTLI